MADIVSHVLSALEIAVFERVGPGEFRALNSLPPWYGDIHGPPAGSILKLSADSPFLENFFIDAEPHWQAGSAGRLASGVWTEVDQHATQHQLEAYALMLAGQSILIIMNLSGSFRDRHHVYQKAREIALDNEKLIRTLNQRQRYLQSMLEKRIDDSENHETISSLIKDNPLAVLICAPDGSVEVINKALIDIYQYQENQYTQKRSLLGKWMREAEALYPEIQRVVACGGSWEGEFESQGLTGKNKWIRLTIGPVLGKDGDVAHYICIANDISDIRRSTRELEKLTDFDLTTQLPNRHSFWRKITRAINDHLKSGKMLALFYVDLDHFKRVNESLGHHAGDFLLNAIATRIASIMTKRDIVAHLGGDEFAVAETIIDERQIEDISRRLLEAISPPLIIDDTQVKISASIGIALFPKDGTDATTLMKYADLAAFHAKERGRNQFQFFRPNMHSQFLSRLNLENDLQKAIDERQFELYYQPQVGLGKDSPLRIEALIRWHHPIRGMVSPGDFIPIAEESGQILEINNWVLRTACAQARLLRDQGTEVIVAVNISAYQIQGYNFIDVVEQALNMTGLPARQLELEITESIFLEQTDSAVKILGKLRSKGVTVSLDDFGSGFSSLNYLKSLPIDNLKIDQVFVRELTVNRESKIITASIIQLAHELRMTVTAEGVETAEQLAILSEQGCDYIQGYYFYRPLPLKELEQALEAIIERQTGLNKLILPITRKLFNGG